MINREGLKYTNFAQIDTPISVDIRGAVAPFTVVKLPFYKRAKN